MEHAGKHALVTGGGSGIGKSIAIALAEAGADVTITGRRANKLNEVAAISTRLHALVMDVDDEVVVVVALLLLLRLVLFLFGVRIFR